MTLPPDLKVVASLRKLASSFNVFVICVGFVVLTGWFLHIRVLASILPQWPATRPVTAICLIFSGISLTSGNLAPGSLKRWLSTAGYILAWLLLAIALLEITLYYTHINVGLENWRSRESPLGAIVRNSKLSLLSCICFLSIGVALIAVRHGAPYTVLQVVSVIVGIPAIVEILDYCFWAGDVYLFSLQKRAALTATCFFLLSLSILFSRPQFGWMSVVSSDTSGGKILRKLLTKILLLIIIFAELGYAAQQYSMINLETNIILSTVIPLLITTFVIMRVAHDLGTEDIRRRQAEQKMEELNKSLITRTEQLEASNEELEQIIKVASHDLTEPVKTISTYSDLILKRYGDKLDHNAATYFNFLRVGTERTREILKDVLTYGSVRRTGTLQTCECNAMVADVLKELKNSIEATHAKVNVQLLPTFLCYANLKLVFHHLIDNAIKFRKTEVPPEITISCETTNSKWHFKIKDNGIGIEQQYFGKIFKLFQRLHPKHKFIGSGIGLALSKKIIGFHDGEMWVESKPNEGSTVHFTLSKTLTSEKKT
jgi:signal transduction histidine kinase